jgi:ribonuclease D
LRVLLKRAAERHGVAQRLIAAADDMEAIAAVDDSAALSGWRRTVFGEEALKLIEGRLAMSIQDGKVRIFDVEPDQATAD